MGRWFIDPGQSQTAFPQLSFFRSPRPQNHWVLAAEAVLDGAALFMTVSTFPVSPAASSASTPEFMP